jgi:hypothetical protein
MAHDANKPPNSAPPTDASGNPLRNIEWPKAEVQRLAESSGKPLEVICAQQFLSARWKARLGSYFTDGELKTLRELDVLAEKEEPLPEWRGAICRLRVLVSCRGFLPERSPMTYSVSTNCVPGFTPRLLSSHRAARAGAVSERTGLLPGLEQAGATQLLRASSLDTARPLVAYDMLERNEVTKQKGKDQFDTTVEYKRCKDGDRQLFTAIDSCVKAAFYWTQQDYQYPASFITLNVPVCVICKPFWDVCIDDGKVSEPEVRQRGYQTNLYPSHPRPQEAMALVWTVDEMAQLVVALDALFAWFRDELKNPDSAK